MDAVDDEAPKDPGFKNKVYTEQDIEGEFSNKNTDIVFSQT
jgi:hypothetical protein